MNSTKITERITDISQREAAIVAGAGLFIMAIIAPFAYFYVLQNLIVPGDAAATASQIMASESLFRIGICFLLISAILDLVVAWALYVLLKPVNKSLSLLSAWFRVAYSVILVVALNNLFNVLELLSGADYLAAFEPNQLQAQVMIFINAFYYMWDLGLVIFGLHLLVLGYLVFKSPYFPRFLGILVVIASLGYLIDSFGIFLFPNYNMTISLFTFIGEVLLIFWLLWRGIKGFDKKKEREL